MEPMITPPDLEKRFLEPDGWQWGEFTRNSRRVRFGFVLPTGNKPDTIIVCLPGLGEMAEKYFELANGFLSKNLGFYVIDWYGQGGSGRFLDNPHKRHSGPFEDYINDIYHLITNHIHNESNAPLAMLAHSMGGNIGLRYLHDHPDTFQVAAFSAPMIGIHATGFLPMPIRTFISRFLNKAAAHSYVIGGSNWSFHKQEIAGHVLSSDPSRSTVSNKWFTTNPSLQIGGVTYGWVHHAIESCTRLYNKETLGSIQTHCLIALAQNDALVDNNAIRTSAELMPNAKLIEIVGSQHEIMMEKDSIRNAFLKKFYELIKKTNDTLVIS